MAHEKQFTDEELLRIFRETRSVTKTAEKLGVSRQAIYQRLKVLRETGLLVIEELERTEEGWQAILSARFEEEVLPLLQPQIDEIRQLKSYLAVIDEKIRNAAHDKDTANMEQGSLGDLAFLDRRVDQIADDLAKARNREEAFRLWIRKAEDRKADVEAELEKQAEALGNSFRREALKIRRSLQEEALQEIMRLCAMNTAFSRVQSRISSDIRMSEGIKWRHGGLSFYETDILDSDHLESLRIRLKDVVDAPRRMEEAKHKADEYEEEFKNKKTTVNQMRR